DRLDRFGDIGGEMVARVTVEDDVNGILGNTASVVTSILDQEIGEKLVAFYTLNGMPTDELWEKLNQLDLAKLWIPKRENFFWIESIPLLGSGKVDLKNVKRLAAEMAGGEK